MTTPEEMINGLEIIDADEIMAKIVNGELINYNKLFIYGDLDIDQFRSDDDSTFIINSSIKIINSKINGRINFGRTILKESINLSNTQFFDTVNFNDAEFCKKALFYGSDFQRETSFSLARFKDHTYFNGTHFKEDLLFTGSYFYKDTFFYGSIFNGTVFFYGSKFYGEADFRNVCFIYQALYSKSEFWGDCIFDCTQFRKEAWFSDCIFKSDVDFIETLFKENAYFQFSQFKNKAKFDGTQFEKDADFASIYMFKWDNIFGTDEGILKEFLAKKFNIKWIISAKFIKGTDGETINASAGKNSISLKFDNINGELSLVIGNGQLKNRIAEVGLDKQTIYGKVDSCFENGASFIGTKVLGDVDFSGHQFVGPADFSKSDFCNNAFFRDSKFKGDAIFNGCKMENVIYFDRAYFGANFALDYSIIRSLRLNGANLGPGSILFINHVDIQRFLVKWEQIRDHLDYNNVIPEAELAERLSSAYPFLIRNFKNLEFFDDERDCTEHYNYSIKNKINGLEKIEAKEIFDIIMKRDAVMCEKCYIFGDLAIQNAMQKNGKFYIIPSAIKIMDSKIQGTIDFNNTIFEGPVILANNVFQGTVNFNNAVFEKTVCLTNNEFQETVNFNNAIFEGPVILTNNTFACDAMFNSIRFKENVQFCRSEFLKDAEFGGTHFFKNSYFNKAFFNRDARFLNSCFWKDAYLIEAKFNGNAFFKKSEFRGELDSRGVEFALDAYFDDVWFYMDAEFFSSQFRGNAEFICTHFKGDAGFGEVQFLRFANFTEAELENASFIKAKFKETAYFPKGTFFENASFTEALFCKDADFSNSVFRKKAKFLKSLFDGTAHFRNSRFFENANFGKAQFNMDADFVGSEFKKAFFKQSTFEGRANFNGRIFAGVAAFHKSKFNKDLLFKKSVFECNAIFNECKLNSNISFYKATFNKNLELDNLIGDAIQLTDVTFKDGSNILFENLSFSKLFVKWVDIKDHLDYSGKTDFKKRTINAYLLLMRNFQDLGLFDEADSCSVLYKTANEIKSEGNEYLNMKKSTIIGFLGSFLDLNGVKSSITRFLDKRLYGYGIFPINPIISSGYILVLFAFIFMIPTFAIQNPIGSLLNASYLSVVVFTSNPSTDPLGGIYALAGIIERICGWLLMAAFLVVLAKKTLR